MLEYRSEKNLPNEALIEIFRSVGWSDGNETESMIQNFNLPFVHSTAVLSAWDGKRLVGCVRILSEQMVRSVSYDLAVLPEYQHQGIGRELVRRCMALYPASEWLLETIPERMDFYKMLGFREKKTPFLYQPCAWFGDDEA